MYRDETLGLVAVHMVGEKLVLHSEIYDRGRLRDIEAVAERIDAAFKRKGVDKLYTWGVTDDQCRFNMFLGYKPTGNEVTGTNSSEPVYEFVKEL